MLWRRSEKREDVSGPGRAKHVPCVRFGCQVDCRFSRFLAEVSEIDESG